MTNGKTIDRPISRNTRNSKASSHFWCSSKFHATPISGGWALILQTKADVLYIIKTERGKPRLFKNIETGAKAAKSIFLPGVYIEFDGWTPEQKKPKGIVMEGRIDSSFTTEQRDLFASGIVAEIGVNAYAVWHAIKYYADYNTGKAFPGMRTIAAKLGIGVGSVSRAIESLERARMLRVVQGHSKRRGQTYIARANERHCGRYNPLHDRD